MGTANFMSQMVSLAGTQKSFQKRITVKDGVLQKKMQMKDKTSLFYCITTQPKGIMPNGKVNGLIVSSVTGSGMGAKLDIVISDNLVQNVKVHAGGQGYSDGDVLKVSSAQIPGAQT